MLRDRCGQSTTTAGAGDYELTGLLLKHRTLAAEYASGAPLFYYVEQGNIMEANEGILTIPGIGNPTVSRGRFLGSSTGAPINWADNTVKSLIVDAPAELFGPLGNRLITAVAGGTVNAITLATSIKTPLYLDGTEVEFEALGAPTGNVTAALNGLAAKSVLYRAGDQICPGDWETGSRLRFVYDVSADAWILPWRRPGWNVGADIASAATLVKPANARDGSYHRITGAVGVANLWTGAPNGIEHEFLVVTGFTITTGANLICPSGANIVAAANDRFKVRHAGSNVWAITSYTRASGKALVETPAAVPTRLKRLLGSAAITVASTTTAVIPNDDTFPQSGEGTQLFNIAGLVPSNGASDIQIEFGVLATHSGAGVPVVFAVFQDAGANAIYATEGEGANNANPHIICGSTIVAAGGAASRDYKLRAGPSAAGTAGINGDTTGRHFNTASRAYMNVWEILP